MLTVLDFTVYNQYNTEHLKHEKTLHYNLLLREL